MHLLWILLGFYYVQFISSQVYNVRDFNATGDGKTDDTSAIRAALAAADNSNGGRVIFDCGLTFLTGAINVTSNVILDLCGTILASNVSDIFHYPLVPPLPWYGGGADFSESGSPERQSVIRSYNATNITLTGGGVVDGQGYPWWACSWSASALEKPPCNNISR
uniref:Pectate lyase superfamily protein domain-containing protein n=1 Tax=Acrobeloides nanus TaxID=290746 RepID=A0A914CSI2_9BILA